MRAHVIFASLTVLATLAAPALAQDDAADPQVSAQRWRIGMVVTAGNSPCGGIVGTITIPTDWPEQKVTVVKEDVSRGVKIRYSEVDDAARQMTVTVTRLAAGEEAQAIVTLDVQTAWQPPAVDTSSYVVPERTKLPQEMRGFLQPSPLIESDDPQIQAIAEQVGVKEPDAWSHVEAIYDWVRQKVEYDASSPLKGARAALRDGTGDCDELTSLFVAVCRAAGIPARTIRVPGHCYPEFYLLDDKGQGHWFPCEAAGARSFGDIRFPKPILQKGDSIRVRNAQTRRSEIVRFLPETLVVKNFRPGDEPKLRLICEPVKP